MKKISFIGVYDKTDFVLYLAKIIRTVGKKVLMVDTTVNQKAKYVVPTIKPTISYITEFENIDVAVGFENYDSIKNYLGISEGKEVEYDYVLFDIDSGKGLDNFQIQPMDENYFVTGFDTYSLKKGLEVFNNIKEPYKLTKILYSQSMLKEEDDYLNFLSRGLKISWNDTRIYLPIENGDAIIIAENQRLAKIKFRMLSQQYKESLLYVAEEALNDVNGSQIRRAMRIIERDKGV